jgi:hypothetical protein
MREARLDQRALALIAIIAALVIAAFGFAIWNQLTTPDDEELGAAVGRIQETTVDNPETGYGGSGPPEEKPSRHAPGTSGAMEESGKTEESEGLRKGQEP